MDAKLKKTIQWTLYVLVIVVTIITLLCLGINILAPTFFPNTDISGFTNYINVLCILLSFLSVGLGMYSIYQAAESGKQANKMINSIQALQKQQELLIVSLKKEGDNTIITELTNEIKWQKDNIIQ